jgi:hypothetical protein
MSNSGKTKAGSLKWAIDELSNQREDLDAKLKIALKRDETNSLIEEVFAQKKALEQRIYALEDGLRVSSDLVDVPCLDLESEIGKIDEKLEIAQERLQAIEQEEYLEELGKKLNRSHSPEAEESSNFSNLESRAQVDSFVEDLEVSNQTSKPQFSPLVQKHSSLPEETSQNSSIPESSTPTLMKATSNRIQATDIDKPVQENSVEETTKTLAMEKTSAASLEETAKILGIEPDFLVEKGLQAILRMIARKGGKLSFPLEVDQID